MTSPDQDIIQLVTTIYSPHCTFYIHDSFFLQLEVYTFNFSLLFISYFHLPPRNYLFVLYIHKSVSLFSCLLICFISSVEFSSSVVSDFCGPMDCSMPVFPVHPQFLELVQIHVHQVSDAIQPQHLMSSPSPHAFNLSQHQGLFK